MTGKVGAPLGNTNSSRGRLVTDQIMIALKEECEHEGEKTNKMRKLASMLVDKALDGDMSAVKEVMDRAEGRPTQRIESDGDASGLVVMVRKFTDAEDDKDVIEHETGEDNANLESQ